MKRGVDVSFHKDFPDWSQAKGHVDFAILAITELYQGIDWTFNHNYDGCRSIGIPVGAYSYSYCRTGADSLLSARKIVKHLAGRPLEMGVWLDLEWDVQRSFSPATLKEIIENFRQGIEEGGYQFGGIYCNGWWYNSFIPNYAKEKYRFWIAGYPMTDTGVMIPSLKPEVPNLAGWQFSEKGHVPGFGAHNVDLDVWYDPIGSDAPESPQKAPEPQGDPYPTLFYGSEGKAVETLQNALNRLQGSGLAVDGRFGDKTAAAVTLYQVQNGLEPDGVVGPLTWGKLKNQLMALRVLADEFGTGEERKKRLEEAGYDYDAVQAEVNRMLS